MTDDRHSKGQTRIPEGTGTNPPAMPGTSDASPTATERDLTPGGPDVDESDRALPGRGRIARNSNPDR